MEVDAYSANAGKCAALQQQSMFSSLFSEQVLARVVQEWIRMRVPPFQRRRFCDVRNACADHHM
eukprot:9881894-Lingulodinium_polyedra.AAC.1